MYSSNSNGIIISANSDIGTELSINFANKSMNIYGTYKTKSNNADRLLNSGVKLYKCDLNDNKSIIDCCNKLKRVCSLWDFLILCTGTQEPIGPFKDCSFDEWENSVKVNFTGQMRIVRELLPIRNSENNLGPCVIFFAGGGTNNATLNYSAYTVSKIALIKMCELLDAEINDTRFVIIGPGWIRTKIHQQTIKAKTKAGDNFEKTRIKLLKNDFTPVEDVISCCEWVLSQPKKIISGRNLSVVFDLWGTEELIKYLGEDFNMYKLRRYGNDLLISKGVKK